MPLRERPEDQQLPEGNDEPVAHEMVREDLLKRLELGISRYGQPLQPFNGRRALQDMYEELLDAAVYVRQLLYEVDHAPYFIRNGKIIFVQPVQDIPVEDATETDDHD